jgi:hypothetical protein
LGKSTRETANSALTPSRKTQARVASRLIFPSATNRETLTEGQSSRNRRETAEKAAEEEADKGDMPGK